MKRPITLFALLIIVFALTLPAFAKTGGIKVGDNLPINPAYILVGMFIGAVAGVITVFAFKSRLRSVSFKEEANDYLRNGSFNLVESTDRLIDKKTERTLRTKNSSIINELRND